MKFMRKSSYRRILPVLLLALLVLIAVPLQARAVTSGKCGQNLTYRISGGTLTISGSGPMADYTEEDAPWAYEEGITKLVVNDGVTTIGASAFRCMFELTEVTLPDSLTSIGNSAFGLCSGLKELEIPESVESIGESTFSDAGLERIVIPGSVEKIGFGCFYYCMSLTDVTIDEGVAAIDSYAFSDCFALVNISIPDSVTSIGSFAFASCNALEEMTIPAGVESIGNKAFYQCKALQQIHFAGTECAIAENAFTGVAADADYAVNSETGAHITLENYGGTLTWHGQGEEEAPVKLTAPVLTVSSSDGKPMLSWTRVSGAEKYKVYRSENEASGYDAVQTTTKMTEFVDDNAEPGMTYYYKVKACHADTALDSDWSNVVEFVCEAQTLTGSCGPELTYIVIDNILTVSGTGEMDDYAQGEAPWNNVPITEAVLEEGVTYIGSYAFADLPTLESVIIPDSVDSIAEDAFLNCGLKSIAIPASLGYVRTWFAACESLEEVTIGDGITEIWEGAFRDCSALHTITIPDSVTWIETNAFAGCASLKEIQLPDTIESIAEGAFAGSGLERITIPGNIGYVGDWFDSCGSLKEVTISDGITEIWDGAFQDCSALSTIAIPDSLTWIGANAFAGCTSLKEIHLPDTVESIAEGAFAGSGLERITIPGNISYVGDWFDSCESLTEVIICEGINVIYDDVFRGCSALTTVTIPEGLSDICAGAFADCVSLKEIRLPGTLTYLGTGAFSGCTSLTELTIPEGVGVLSEACFENCTALRSVTFPAEFSTIDNLLFSGCTALETVRFPAAINWIGDDAFADCTGLKSIYFSSYDCTISDSAFKNVTANVYYAVNANTGESVITDNYGGSLTWIDYCKDGHAYEDGLCKYCEKVQPVKLATPVLTVSNNSDGKPVLNWTRIADAAKYKVYRSIKATSGYTAVKTTTKMTEYTDTDTEPGTTYYYKVKAYHDEADYHSEWSNVVECLCRNKILTGSCGSGLTYVLEEGTLTISGTGAMTDYVSCGPWYGEDIQRIVIEKGVTTVGNMAFTECANLTEVILPDGLTTIGENAFSLCTNLSSITIPSTVTRIKDFAFAGCSGLKDVYFLGYRCDISDVAFLHTTLNAHFTMNSETGEWIANRNYGGTTTWIDYCETGHTYENDVCKYCKKKLIKLEAPVLTMTWLMEVQPQLTWNDVGEGVTYKVFRSTKETSGYTEMKSTQNRVFSEVIGECKTYYYKVKAYHPESSAHNSDWSNVIKVVTKLNTPSLFISDTFEDKLWLSIDGSHEATSYRIYRSTKKSSGYTLLATCDGGYYAYYRIDSLEPGITYYYKVKAYHSDSTYNSDWSNVVEYTYEAEELPEAITGTCGENLTYTYLDGTLTISGTGPMADYSDEDAPWYEWAEEDLTTLVIEEGVTTIGDAAFAHCWELKKVSLPDTLTSIGGSAFQNCSSLEKITIPKSVKTLGSSAFMDCSSLQRIEIPGSVGTIPFGCFYYCTNLEEVTIGEGITAIEDYVFSDCTSLESAQLPKGVTSIGNYAFCRTALYSVQFPESLITVGNGAFYECKNLNYFYYAQFYNQDLSYFLSNLTTIGSNAFYGCTDMSFGFVTSKVNSIGEGAFGKCTALERITFETFKCTIGKNAFEGVTAEVYYPVDPKTGDHVALENYGGTITWIDSCANGHYFHKLYEDGKICLNCGAEQSSKLPAPTLSISANTTTGKPKLSWNKIEGAEKYRIYRSTKKTSGFEYLKSTQTATSFTDTTAEAGTNYYYKIKAYHADTSRNSDWSNTVNRVCDLAKPTVSITGSSSSGKPIVKWETVEGAVKYRIYRSTQKSSGFELVYTGVTARSYTDKTAEAGTLYYYKVKAIHSNSSADSAYSETLARTCDLARPVVTITLKSGDPRLTWEKIEGAEKYYVYRATSKDGEYQHVKTTKTASSFTDTTAETGTTYYYKVKAVHSNTAANSAYSAIDSIKAE